jgi:hypothetical protein
MNRKTFLTTITALVVSLHVSGQIKFNPPLTLQSEFQSLKQSVDSIKEALKEQNYPYKISTGSITYPNDLLSNQTIKLYRPMESTHLTYLEDQIKIISDRMTDRDKQISLLKDQQVIDKDLLRVLEKGYEKMKVK